ncbi:MAG: hypothetical protein HYZ50_22065 [Deltaproteobacteria bacterium]|nr:hypothetical protein [Deltaproteobacteria bacterium]
MNDSDCVIVLGLLGQFPLAGIAWQLIHHLIGLQRLGFEVYYIEDTGTAPYDPRLKSLVYDCSYSVRYIETVLRRVGLEQAWAYRDGLHDQWYGLTSERVRDLFARAVCAINLCGASNPLALAFRPRGKLIYLETDPVLYQVRLAQGDRTARQFLAAHDAHVTYGENLGASDCPIPLPEFAWKKTRPPVVLDLWPPRAEAPGARFTTVATWHNRGKDLQFQGQTYYWSKHVNFLALADLPCRAAQALELSVEIDNARECEIFQRGGWILTNPLVVSQDMQVYQDYIATSRGEITVAKDAVVRTKSGWFSDRSVCYLAAGRPVVTQDTGFSKFIPTGEGLFGFSSPEEAQAALAAIAADYPRQARAAREIAHEYFAAEKILGRMLAEVGIW